MAVLIADSVVPAAVADSVQRVTAEQRALRLVMIAAAGQARGDHVSEFVTRFQTRASAACNARSVKTATIARRYSSLA